MKQCVLKHILMNRMLAFGLELKLEVMMQAMVQADIQEPKTQQKRMDGKTQGIEKAQANLADEWMRWRSGASTSRGGVLLHRALHIRQQWPTSTCWWLYNCGVKSGAFRASKKAEV